MILIFEDISGIRRFLNENPAELADDTKVYVKLEEDVYEISSLRPVHLDQKKSALVLGGLKKVDPKEIEMDLDDLLKEPEE